jgi:hypothetical protein
MDPIVLVVLDGGEVDEVQHCRNIHLRLLNRYFFIHIVRSAGGKGSRFQIFNVFENSN